MTDADDAVLVEALASSAWYHGNDTGRSLWEEAAEAQTLEAKDRAALLERLSTLRREIEELRRERDIANEAWKGTRCAELREQVRAEKAEAALVEALKVITPLAKLSHMGNPNYDYDMLADGTLIMVRLGTLRAASAFAAKHGGRDG